MRIAVVGASGFVGSRVVEALASSGVDLVVDRRIELDRLRRVDAVVDASGRRDLDLARFCLESGIRLVDCSADAERTGELLALDATGPGALIAGAGLFPGVSNLIAARDPSTRAILVELDPFSGAGAKTIDSLTGALADPNLRCKRVGGIRALAIDSADQRISGIELLITTRQRWMRWSLPLAAWIGRRPLFGRVLARIANLGMKLLRGVVLRRRPASVTLYAVGASGPTVAFETRDGFAATARAIAWAAVETANRADLRGLVPFTELSRTAPAARS